MRKRLLLLLILILTFVWVGCAPTKPTEAKLVVHMIDVGQGDSILLQAGNSAVLIDAGERNKGSVVLDYLNKQKISKLDLFICTHPHSDHIGGSLDVRTYIEVKQVIDSGKVHTSQTYIDYLKYIDEKDIPFDIAANQSIKLGSDVVLNIIGPTREYSNLNDNSVVAKVTVGTQAVMLTGDMEHAAEKDLLPVANVSATILKVGHHGSKTSTTPDFLKAVGPKVALISVGQGNTYGHPASETVDRLTSMGAQIFRTDMHGSIKVFLDGKSFTVVTEKQAGK